jgi:hypothetical protein
VATKKRTVKRARVKRSKATPATAKDPLLATVKGA